MNEVNFNRHSKAGLTGKIHASALCAAGLAAGLMWIGAQAAQAQPARLIIEEVRCISPSSGTDAGTSVLFSALGAATAVVGGAAIASNPITLGMVASGASGGAAALKGLASTIRGEDDLYINITIRPNAVHTGWPTDAYSRTIDAGETEPVNMSWDFDNSKGIRIDLYERDTGSANDFMGGVDLQNLKLPYQGEIVIANDSEHSFYVAKIQVKSVAGTGDAYRRPDASGGVNCGPKVNGGYKRC